MFMQYYSYILVIIVEHNVSTVIPLRLGPLWTDTNVSHGFTCVHSRTLSIHMFGGQSPCVMPDTFSKCTDTSLPFAAY